MTPIVELRGVTRRFGPTVALADIDMAVEAGTIHALVGENGAGKSTALGILGGRISPSAGEALLHGEALPHGNPRAARERGLAVIYQELTIVPDLDAAGNVFIGHPLARRGLLAERRMQRAYEELCARFGVAAQPAGMGAGQLSVADQQVVEILRALAFDASVILFDEPTASLGMSERKALLALMKGLREGGKTMIFVSHNLDEVLELADAITVFRNGRRVATAERDRWDKASVVDSMVGEAGAGELAGSLNEELVGDAPTARRSTGREPGKVVLEVRDLRLEGAVEGASFDLREGEILGLGGLVGSGRSTVLRTLAGLTPGARGGVRLGGEEIGIPRSVRAARRHGIALLPEDRKGEGLAPQMSGAVNVLMGDTWAASRFGVVSERKARGIAAAAAREFGFDPERIADPAEQLSGGNQQKLLLARLAHSRPRVMLVDEPTKGIDIRAKEEVLRALERMAGQGMAVVFVSSELEEVALISDRVVVLAEGHQTATLDASATLIGVADILAAAFAAPAGV
jgi:ABC-type sugar transport system ATPase subunit